MKRSVLFPLITTLLVFQTISYSIGGAEEVSVSSAPSAAGRSLVWGRASNLVDISLGYFFSKSDSSWEISFQDQFGRSRSVLDFNGMSGGMPILSLDVHHPKAYASLSFQFGKGQDFKGEGTDSDYLSNGTFHRSRFDADGEKVFWTADIQTTFSFSSKPRWSFKPFIGWQHYEEKLKMTNGRWTVLYGVETDTPIPGLASSYAFNWNALRLGIRGDMDLAPPRKPGIGPLGFKTHLAFFPYIHYSGRGEWNLRDDLRKDPSFSHKADNFGILGLDGAISLVYRPLKFLEIEGGGQLTYFYVQDGTDTTFFSNNTVAKVSLDEVNSLQVGLFIKITGRF